MTKFTKSPSACLVALLFLAAALQSVHASRFCGSKPGPIQNNTLPYWDGQPRLKKEVPNGRMYEVGDKAYNNTMKLLHVYGTMEEMGAAQGYLLGSELAVFLTSVWSYIEGQVVDALPGFIPASLQLDIANFGMELGLDLTYTLTYKYTTHAYYDEMRAMVVAANCSELYAMAVRVHMIGEITKGHCSMFGLWGPATKKGDVLQLRALDWDFDGPFRKYPALIVYHPSDDSQGYGFINIGFTGWLGMLSGINEYNMAISEIGVSYPEPSFGSESRVGNVFTFMMRDLIQYEKTLQGAINRLVTNNRTCDLILGVGDGKPEVATFRGFQVSYSVCNVVDDTNLIPNATWHPQIPGAVYWGMDWLCKNWDLRLAELINQYYGQIDADIAVRNIVSGLTSGNLQVVVYDLTNMVIYVAYGYKSEDGSFSNKAYKQSFVKLDVRKLFAEPKPTIQETMIEY